MNLRNQIKVICIDLDNTLLKDKTNAVSSANSTAIIAAKKLGIKIVVVTGRAFKTAISPSRQIKADYLISSNGAKTYDFAKEAYIYQKFLNLSALTLSLETVRALPNVFGFFYSSLASQKTSKIYTLGESNNPAVSRIIGLFEIINLNEVKTPPPFACFHMLFFGNAQDLLTIQNVLAKTSLNIIFDPESNSLDIYPPQINKAFAVAEIAKMLSVNVETELMAFGDNTNDLSLFRTTNYGVAVDNAISELKKCAFFIAESEADNGVAKAIHRFILDPN